MFEILTAEFAEKYDLPYGPLVVANQDVRESRWGTYKICIFRLPEDETLWGFEWFYGATEYQEDDYPWSYAVDFKVHAYEEYEVVVKQYRKVEEPSE